MADVPTEAPHHVAKKAAGKGLSALKGLPTWAYIVIGGALIALILYFRHHQAQQAANTSDQNAGTSYDPSQNDPYGAYVDTSGLSGSNYPYPSDLFGGGAGNPAISGGVGSFPSGTGSDAPGSFGSGPEFVNPNDPTFSMPTGGGPPSRPQVHGQLTPEQKSFDQNFNKKFDANFNKKWEARQRSKTKQKSASRTSHQSRQQEHHGRRRHR